MTYTFIMIKELRLKTGLSQQDFADRFNIPVSTLRQWEQGRRKAPDYVFALLNEVLQKQERKNRYMFPVVVAPQNLARAKVKRDNAEYNYQRISVDDAYLEACCNDLQQAIEFTLKYCVEMTGQAYVENHDVRAQINLLDNAKADIPCKDRLRQLAPMLLEWEASSRYNDNFVAMIEDIDDAREIADALIAHADALVIKVNTK